jgi:hypothetical protein
VLESRWLRRSDSMSDESSCSVASSLPLIADGIRFERYPARAQEYREQSTDCIAMWTSPVISACPCRAMRTSLLHLRSPMPFFSNRSTRIYICRGFSRRASKGLIWPDRWAVDGRNLCTSASVSIRIGIEMTCPCKRRGEESRGVQRDHFRAIENRAGRWSQRCALVAFRYRIYMIGVCVRM